MKTVITLTLLMALFEAGAQADRFKQGKVITGFGQIAEVELSEPLPVNSKFKVSFDVFKQGDIGKINRSIESAARFINMHAAVGVNPNQIQLALVIHGGAVSDVTNDQFYSKNSENKEVTNANKELILELQKHGVKIYVCGQSAAYYGVTKDDLLPQVKMSLSAMTAHALLQQQGYTLNPF